MKCSNHMDSAECTKILEKSGIVEELNAKYRKYKYFFMQDGATPHLSQEAMTWLRSRARIMPGWPPNSPDLNPIEMIWSIIKMRIRGLRLTTVDEISQAVERTWESLEQRTIDGLVSDFKFQCQLVLECKGESNSGMLSSHMSTTGNMINTEGATVMRFSPQEDAWIVELQTEYGNQKTKIGSSLQRDLPWQFVRHRYMTLRQMEVNDILAAHPPELPGISELEVPASLASSIIFLSNVCGIEF